MFQYFPSGDSAIIIKAGDEISVEINRIVRQLTIVVDNENIKGVIDLIPSYNELMICYNPTVIEYLELVEIINSVFNKADKIILPESEVKVVPVLYGGEYGPDLKEVATFNNLTEEEVIEVHTSADYLVFMLGFTPGFCYLGGMDKRIATPRKQNPLLKIPEGAVGIANEQTGIYPIESPGGWQIIGRTPLKLFNPGKVTEFLFQIGDTIRFRPISESEFKKLKESDSNECN